MAPHACSNLSLNYTQINIDQDTIPVPSFTVHDFYPSLHKLRLSADAGCELCLLLIQTIKEKAAGVLETSSQPEGEGEIKHQDLEINVSMTQARWRMEESVVNTDDEDKNGAHTLVMDLEFYNFNNKGEKELLGECIVYFSIHIDEGQFGDILAVRER